MLRLLTVQGLWRVERVAWAGADIGIDPGLWAAFSIYRHRHLRAGAVHRDLCRNVPHDFGQLPGIDLVEETVELDMFRHCPARSKQLDVILDRLLEVRNGEAI